MKDAKLKIGEVQKFRVRVTKRLAQVDFLVKEKEKVELGKRLAVEKILVQANRLVSNNRRETVNIQR